jgi:hypothetical protein
MGLNHQSHKERGARRYGPEFRCCEGRQDAETLKAEKRKCEKIKNKEILLAG